MSVEIFMKEINQVPLLECVDQTVKDKSAPLLVFYHGWTSCKEECTAVGLELARRGYRVLLPDCKNHGQRRVKDLPFGNEEFIDTLFANIQEYPTLVDYYKSRNLIQEDYLSVGGISMGGITSAILLRLHESIRSGAILMGSPQLLKLARHLIQNYLEEDAKVVSDLSIENMQKNEDQLIQMLETYQSFYAYDLSLDMDCLMNRPVYFWHGKEDRLVDYHLTEEFIGEIQARPAGRYVYFDPEEGRAHSVVYKEIYKTGAFLQAAYQWRQDLDQVWPQAVEEFKHRFKFKDIN